MLLTVRTVAINWLMDMCQDSEMFVLLLLLSPLLVVVVLAFPLACRSSSSRATKRRVVPMGSAAGVVGLPLLSGCWGKLLFTGQ